MVTACSDVDETCDQYSKCTVRDPLWRLKDRIVQGSRRSRHGASDDAPIRISLDSGLTVFAPPRPPERSRRTWAGLRYRTSSIHCRRSGQGQAELLDRLEAPHPQQILLQRADGAPTVACSRRSGELSTKNATSC